MMRLIDEEDVISLLVSHHFDDDKKNYDLLIHNLCNEVKRIPTAYDVDEVVDRLESLDSGRIDYDYMQRMFPPTAAEFLAKYPTVSEEEYRKNPEKAKAFLESETEKKKNNVVKFSKR